MNSLRQMENQSLHHSIGPQISSNPPEIQFHDSHFDPNPPDDFLDQMFSNLPSCSWNDLKSPWDLNPDLLKPRDLLEDTNGVFNFDDSSILASKLRQQQISGGNDSSVSAASTAAAKMMLQQQLLLSIGEGEGSANAMFNGFGGSMLGAASQTLNQPQAQNYGRQATAAMNQAPAAASGSTGGGAPAQTRQRVRARRGQATDPHSIAERLRRERIAERMKALQELVPNANKTDKASMLDEIIDYVKFLQLQVKVLSMSRLGGASAVAPPLAKTSIEVGRSGDCTRPNSNASSRMASSNDNLTVAETQVAKLMEEDMGSAMQYLQGKGLCLMPISLATAISSATAQSRNPLIGNITGHPILASNGEGPTSPSMSVLTVQSTTVGHGGPEGSVKEVASVSKP